MGSFATGSRVYGQPREDSDLDLVIRMTEREFNDFVNCLTPKQLDELIEQRNKYGLLENGQAVLRFGQLNLIICLQDRAFEAWRSATRIAQNRVRRNGPLSREQSVELFKHIFQNRGLE